MNRYLLYATIFGIFILASCTKNFNEINTNPTLIGTKDYDPNNLFATGELGYANISEYQLLEFACMTQTMASTMVQYGGGDKYNNQLLGYNGQFFLDGQNYASQLVAAQNLAEQKDATKYSNLIQMSRIMWVLSMQRITDIYGDIPYSESGKVSQGILKPKYDEQSSIYPDMLEQLNDAIGKLDASKPLATGDMIYKGDIAQWKKLGYSIMLRVAMRLVKVDPATAKKYAEMASGKTFASSSDNAIMKMSGGSDALTVNKTMNDLLTTSDFQELRWSNTFINYLLKNNDPRLYVLAEKADTGLTYNNDIAHAGILYTPKGAAPVGMPNGYDLSGTTGIQSAPNYPGATGTNSNASPLGNYARPRFGVFAKRNFPICLISYAQTELLLAEASARGWSISGSALQHYQNGVQSAVQTLAQLDESLAIPADSTTKFVNNLKLGSTLDSSLNAINSQYWVASLFDFAESWSNWRRTGFPVLTPVNYVNNITNGTIPRRLPYPGTENQANALNYQAALQRMGGADLPTNRVWWDVK